MKRFFSLGTIIIYPKLLVIYSRCCVKSENKLCTLCVVGRLYERYLIVDIILLFYQY